MYLSSRRTVGQPVVLEAPVRYEGAIKHYAAEVAGVADGTWVGSALIRKTVERYMDEGERRHEPAAEARAAHAAADVRLELGGQRDPLGKADDLIARICLSRSAELLTGNRDHFSRIGDLELSDL